MLKYVSDKEISDKHIAISNILYPFLQEKKYKNLKELLRNEQVSQEALVNLNLSDNDDILESSKAIVEEDIKRQLFYFANIQHLIMERKDDYGILGEQRLALSFCRLIRNIKPNIEVSQFDIDLCRREIIRKRKEYNIYNMGTEELQKVIMNFKIFILGNKVVFDDMKKINSLLAFIGSNKKLFASFKLLQRSFVYGKAKIKKIDKYFIYIFEQEDMRSPYACLSIIAGNANNNINIRKLSAETVFYNKWQRVFEYSKHEKRRLMRNLENNIGETIKSKALQKYGITDLNSIEKVKDLFIDEIIEGVLWHELGHTIANDFMLDAKYFALAKTLHSYKDDLSIVFLEFLADWAYKQGNIEGPINFFCSLYQKGEVDKAQRMIFAYLSDNWFLSNDETEGILQNQTDIIVASLIKFFNQDGFDFDSFIKEEKILLEKFLLNYKLSIDKVIDTIKRAIFNINGQRLGFSEIDLKIRNILAGPICQKALKEQGENVYQVFYWANIFAWLKKYALDVFRQIPLILSNAMLDFKNEMLNILATTEASQYPSLREYIFSMAKQKGLFTEVDDISNEEAINMAIEESFIPFSYKESIQSWFLEILQGKEINIEINYDVEINYGISILQDMLLKSGFGNIEDGIVFNAQQTNINSEAIRNKELMKNANKTDTKFVTQYELDMEKQVADRLITLQDYLAKKSFLSIKHLKVNLTYITEERFEKVINDTKVIFEETLADKIHNFEMALMPPSKVLEVEISIEKGFWDWNTFNAFARINKELEISKDYKKVILNKKVLEEVIKRYVNSY